MSGMAIVLVSAFVTISLGLSIIAVLLVGRSDASARLLQVTSRDLPAQLAEPASPRHSDFTEIFAPVRDLLAGKNDDTAKRLATVGFRDPAHVNVFFALKLLLPIVGALAGSFIDDTRWFWMVIFAGLGFYLPEFWLGRAIKNRCEKMRLALPDAIDLLVICMEAGLGIDQALVRVGHELRMICPALSEELVTINHEQRAGKPRIDAWRSMAERTGLEVVQQFVSMLVQTERFGTPIARSLGQFADSLRLQRMQKAEEIAAKTTVKLIFPLVACVFPALFLVLLGPAVLAISRGLAQLAK
jgi:tight adherence protein C